jgi:hypothetical protein
MLGTNYICNYTIFAELRSDPNIHLWSANNKSSKRLGIECLVLNAIYIKYCRKYRYRGASRPHDSGLNVFINGIVGYIDLGGLHAKMIGRLNIFINWIVGCIDLGGFHAPLIGELNIFVNSM